MLASAQPRYTAFQTNFPPAPVMPQYLPHTAHTPASQQPLKLDWQSETLECAYTGEVALFFEAGDTIHCEALENGHWHIWHYQNNKVETIQKGQLNDIAAAQAACQRVMQHHVNKIRAAKQETLPHITPLPNPTHPLTANPIAAQSLHAPHIPFYIPPKSPAEEAAYDNAEDSTAHRRSSFRSRLRVWALFTTLVGAALLTLWYGFLLQPVKTTSIVLCIILLSWAGMHLRRWWENVQQNWTGNATLAHASVVAPVAPKN